MGNWISFFCWIVLLLPSKGQSSCPSLFENPLYIGSGITAMINPGKFITEHFKGTRLGGHTYSSLFSIRTGTRRIQDILDPNHKENEYYHSASIIIGLDLFYWDASEKYQKCNKSSNEVIDAIKRLTEKASEDGKALILGNVPKLYGWYKLDFKCVDIINDTLAEHCTVDNGCYLFDFYQEVKTLKVSLSGGGNLSSVEAIYTHCL